MLNTAFGAENTTVYFTLPELIFWWMRIISYFVNYYNYYPLFINGKYEAWRR